MIYRHRGEIWVNGWGIFYSGLYGLETPQGRALYFRSPLMWLRIQRLRKAAVRRYNSSAGRSVT